MSVHAFAVQNLTLLRDLPRDHQEKIASQMTERSYARREIVMRKDDSSPHLGFLLDGRLQGVDFTVDGREVGLYFVDESEYFGELSVIDGRPRSEHIIAVARSRVAFLPRELARQVMFLTPNIAEQVAGRLARRIRAVSAHRTILSLPNPLQRICAHLVELATALADGSLRIEHAPTHQEIAIMLNTSRETVTRTFQVLQSKGIVRRHEGQIGIERPDSLRAIALGAEDPPK